MPRSRIDRDAVLAAALGVVDAGGLEALTLSNVAEVLEVRPSALYTHVDGTSHLHYVVAVRATTDLTAQVRDAAVGVAGAEALLSMANAYQAFAAEHPGWYAATLAPPPAEGDDGLDQACADLLGVMAAVMRGLGLSEDACQAAAVSMRAGLHGFVALQPPRREAGGTGRAAPGDDASVSHFTHLVEALIRGLTPPAT
ncbi:MAG: TetR-like C-terminal domain-containing protein [Actinomycetota bacterium]